MGDYSFGKCDSIKVKVFIDRIVAFLRACIARRRCDAALTEKQKTGIWGEQIAVKTLKDKGYSIVGKRVRPDAKNDEIDIIASKGRMLVFVEVKTRKDERFGRPASAVDRRKKQALCRGAAAFLRHSNYPDFCYRFDIIEVVGTREAPEPPVVRHIEDAFRFPLRYRFPTR